VLAVSDPAADVTSTQTWRAVAEGRSTGIWTAPAGLRADGETPVAPLGAMAALTSSPPTAPPTPGRPGTAPPTPGRPGTALPKRQGRHGPGAAAGRATPADTGPTGAVGTGLSARVSTGPNPRVTTGPNPRVTTGPNPRVTTGPNPRISTGPNPRISTAERATAASDATGTGRTGARGRRAAAGASRPRRHWPISVKLAAGAALLLVLAAAGILAYTVLHDSPKPHLTGQSRRKPSAAASASPSLGPYGPIASRQTDPEPLTLAQLFPASFIDGGATVTSAATNLSGNCASAIVGAKLQSAVGAADCSQVARATYLDLPGSLMATIGVLNLGTTQGATTAAQSADANDYISQLTASSGPAQQIGTATGIEEALAKGHYLILLWAQFTNVSKPTTQQVGLIENFMTEVLQNTANLNLTTRMLAGTP
jgi:hypothetical protein